MNESMARRSPLDLTQADQVTALEIAATMFELPKGRIGRTGVENVAHLARLATAM